jgi:hypothetical protein
VVISDAVLRAVGVPNNARPDWLRVGVVLVALLPLIVYVISSLWPGRRFTRALAQEGAWARIDEHGIELWLAPNTIHPWAAVAGLSQHGRVWDLVGMDGSVIGELGEELVYPRGQGWTDSRSLAEQVVELRPDRYAVRGSGGWTTAVPSEFALRTASDVVGVPSRRNPIVPVVFGLLAVITLVAVLLWLR